MAADPTPLADTVGSALAATSSDASVITAPVTDTVSAAVAETNDTTVAPLTDTVSGVLADTGDTTDGIVAPLSGTLQGPTDAAAPLAEAATGTIAEKLDSTVAAVGDSASSAGAPVFGALDATVTPIVDTTRSVAASGDAALAPIVDTTRSVAASGDAALAPVGDPVEAIRETGVTIADTGENATMPLAAAVAGPTGVSGTSIDDVGATTGAGADATEVAVGEAIGAAPSGGAQPGGVGTEPAALADARVSDVATVFDDRLAGAAGAQAGGEAGPLFDDPVLVAAAPGDPVAGATPSGAPLSGAAGAPAGSDDSVLGAMAATVADPRVLAATGVAFLIGARLGASRVLCHDEARILFTNVRLLPCLVRDGVSRHVAELASALATTGRAGPVAALSPALATEAAGGTGSAGAVAAGQGSRDVRGLWQLFRDGFDQGVEPGRGDVGGAVGDSGLMIRLGMLLGFVYAAFLSVWFWATRRRRRRRTAEETARRGRG